MSGRVDSPFLEAMDGNLDRPAWRGCSGIGGAFIRAMRADDFRPVTRSVSRQAEGVAAYSQRWPPHRQRRLRWRREEQGGRRVCSGRNDPPAGVNGPGRRVLGDRAVKKRDTRTVSPVGPVLSSNRNYSYRLNMRRPCFSTWLQGGAFLASAVHTWALHRAPYSLESSGRTDTDSMATAAHHSNRQPAIGRNVDTFAWAVMEAHRPSWGSRRVTLRLETRAG